MQKEECRNDEYKTASLSFRIAAFIIAAFLLPVNCLLGNP
jgi:hypothetical protein